MQLTQGRGLLRPGRRQSRDPVQRFLRSGPRAQVRRRATVAPRAGRSAGSSGSLIDIERPLPELTEDLIGQVERAYFVRLLARYKGNVARCAKLCVVVKVQKFRRRG